MSKLTICIYGAASESIDEKYLKDGVLLGFEIAGRGHRLIYGAGGTGLMGAVAHGAKELNGEIIGVLPKFMSAYESLFQGCSRVITTETMAERKAIMEEAADAFIITPGGIGTMDEFFQILTLKSLDQKDSPIAIYNSNGFFDKIIAFIEEGIAAGFIMKEVKDAFFVSDKASEILDYVERNAK